MRLTWRGQAGPAQAFFKQVPRPGPGGGERLCHQKARLGWLVGDFKTKPGKPFAAAHSPHLEQWHLHSWRTTCPNKGNTWAGVDSSSCSSFKWLALGVLTSPPAPPHGATTGCQPRTASTKPRTQVAGPGMIYASAADALFRVFQDVLSAPARRRQSWGSRPPCGERGPSLRLNPYSCLLSPCPHHPQAHGSTPSCTSQVLLSSFSKFPAQPHTLPSPCPPPGRQSSSPLPAASHSTDRNIEGEPF